MNNEERDELLVRVDERIASLHTWTEKHEGLHKEARETQRKWLGIIFTSLAGILVRIIFWK